MAGSPSEPFGGCGGNWASSLSVPESRQASRVRSGECWGHGAGWGPHAPGLAPAPHCRVQARRPGALAAHVFCWIPVPPSGGGSAHWGASAMAFSTRTYQGWMRV